MFKVIVGGLVAGIVVFFWGAIAHMALPIGQMGVSTIAGEEKVVGAMKDTIHEPGLYLFPGRDMSKAISKSEEEAYMAKLKQGPTGLMVVHPEGREYISSRQLITEFASSVVCALIAGLVLTQVRTGFVGRVFIVTLMGVFAFVSVNISYWNWYGFPTDYTIGTALDEVIGWFLGGVVLACVIRPAKIPKVEVPG